MMVREPADEASRRAGIFPRVEVGYTGLFFVLTGGIVTCAGWGSWWVLLGFGMLLLGVYWADRLRTG